MAIPLFAWLAVMIGAGVHQHMKRKAKERETEAKALSTKQNRSADKLFQLVQGAAKKGRYEDVEDMLPSINKFYTKGVGEGLLDTAKANKSGREVQEMVQQLLGGSTAALTGEPQISPQPVQPPPQADLMSRGEPVYDAPTLEPSSTEKPPVGIPLKAESVSLTADGSITARFAPNESKIFMDSFEKHKREALQQDMDEYRAVKTAFKKAVEETDIIPQNLKDLTQAFLPDEDARQHAFYTEAREIEQNYIREGEAPHMARVLAWRDVADVMQWAPEEVKSYIYPGYAAERQLRVVEAGETTYRQSMARFQAAAGMPIPGDVRAELGLDPEIKTYNDLAASGKQYLKSPDQRKAYAFMARAKGALKLFKKLSKKIHTSKGGFYERGKHSAHLKWLAGQQPDALKKGERSLASNLVAYERYKESLVRMFMSVAGETAARLSDFDAKAAKGMIPKSGIGGVVEFIDSKEVAENNLRDMEELIDSSMKQILTGYTVEVSRSAGSEVPTEKQILPYKMGTIRTDVHGRKAEFAGIDDNGEEIWLEIIEE